MVVVISKDFFLNRVLHNESSSKVLSECSFGMGMHARSNLLSNVFRIPSRMPKGCDHFSSSYEGFMGHVYCP